MKDKYKVLLVEQLKETVEVIAKAVERSIVNVEFLIAESKEAFLAALNESAPHAILFDASFSGLDVAEAIELLKNKPLFIPFIIISDKFDEAFALSLVRNAVDDYILKDHVSRLPFALINAIEKFEQHREHQQLLYKTFESEALSKQQLGVLSNKLLLATNVAGIGVWEYCFKEQKFTADEIVFSLYGIPTTEYDGSFAAWLPLVHKDDQEKVKKNFEETFLYGTDHEAEFRIVRRDGSVRYIKGVAVVQKDADGNPSRVIGTNQDITERIEWEKTIRESELKYRSFFENSLDGILITKPNGEILAANPAACAIFQMSEDEFCAVGRSGIVDVTDPLLEPLIRERNLNGKAKGEITFVRKDGKKFPGEVTSAIYKNAEGMERSSLIIRDVTERKQTEQKIITTSIQLQDAVRDLEKIMNSSLDIICTIDVHGKFVTVSSACEKIWGYKPEEMINRKYMELVYEEDVEKTIETGLQIRSGSPVTMFENRYIHKDGAIVPVLWSATWDTANQLMYCIGRDATEKKKLEKAFESERQRIYELFLHAPCSVGMFRGPDHVFEIANDLYLQLTGRKNIVGKTVREVFPEIENQGLFDILDEVYRTGIPFIANERLIKVDKRGNGKFDDIYLNFIYQAYRNSENEIEGVFFFAIDVTEQVVSRKKIEESERKFRQIVETAQEGIWMVDEGDRTVFVNNKISQLLGYEPEEMIGRTKCSFKSLEDKKRLSERVRDEGFKESKVYETLFLTKNGKQLWARVSANPIYDEDGSYKGALAMVADITERKLQDLQLQKNAEEREILVDELTRSIKDLKQFAYITSHNFRAPLSNLIALLGLFDHESLTPGNREVVQMFKASTLQLNKTINDLIQILIIKNNVNVERSTNKISDLLSDVTQYLAGEIAEVDCQIKTHFEVEEIVFNKSYLESVLLNLMSNAIKFRSRKRKLEIEIKTQLRQNGEVVILVKDNGMGIDLNRHGENLFGLYQRFHSNADSTGLGLFIVKSQINALGGTINVESEVDKGTTFFVTLKSLAVTEMVA